MPCQGCNQRTTWTLVSVRKVLKETSNSTIKSLPFSWIIVPLFEQLAAFSAQAQTQIIIMNAPCWEGPNKEQSGMSRAEYTRCELRRQTPSTFTNYGVFPTSTFTSARANLKLVYREREAFLKHETVEVQYQDSFKVWRERGFRFLQLILQPNFCLLAQTHPLRQHRAVHLTDTVPDNESVSQHTLLCQHKRS